MCQPHRPSEIHHEKQTSEFAKYANIVAFFEFGEYNCVDSGTSRKSEKKVVLSCCAVDSIPCFDIQL